MDAIDILINEHKNIRKVLDAIKHDSEELPYGKEVDIEFYRNVIDFVRNYADKYHHKKEEKKLFNIMGEKDEKLKNGPLTGMLLEHDLGRMYIRNLENELDRYENGDGTRKAYIIASALSYATMLESHIEKEDSAIYQTARRVLDKDVQEKLKNEYEQIESDESSMAIKDKYLSFADKL